MSIKRILCVIAAILSATVGLRGEEAGKGLPYNTVNLTMKVLKSQKVDGVDCVPFYLKAANKGEKLDVEKAKFRVRTWDGEIFMLKVSLLSEIPPEDRTEFEKEMIEKGFTHIQWIPKDEKKYLDGDLIHDLPKGSVEMAQGLKISGKFPKDEKQK